MHSNTVQEEHHSAIAVSGIKDTNSDTIVINERSRLLLEYVRLDNGAKTTCLCMLHLCAQRPLALPCNAMAINAVLSALLAELRRAAERSELLSDWSPERKEAAHHTGHTVQSNYGCDCQNLTSGHPVGPMRPLLAKARFRSTVYSLENALPMPL